MKLRDILIFASGLALGGVLLFLVWPGAAKQEAQKTKAAQSSEASYRFISPLATCMQKEKLVMDEIRTFRFSVIAYLEKLRREHPSYKVAYYFRDLNNGIWIGFDEKEKFSPASLMKVPVMVAVLKEAEHNPGLLQTELVYDSTQFRVTDYAIPHQHGKAYSVETLLKEMISKSDNIATVMLVNLIGYDKVTKVDEDLNIYIEKTASSQDNIISIKNYASIFRILFNASYLSPALSEKALHIMTVSDYEFGIRAGLPDKSIIVADKYGERDDIDEHGNAKIRQLHNFGIVYYPRKPYLIGVMIKGDDRAVMQRVLQDLSHLTYAEVDKQIRALEQSKIHPDAR